jgi:hypothetical protein
VRTIDVYCERATAANMDVMRAEVAASFDELGWRNVGDEIRKLPAAGTKEWQGCWVRCFMLQTWRLGLAGREFGTSVVVRDRKGREKEAEAAKPHTGDKVNYDLRKLADLVVQPLLDGGFK